MGPSGTQPCQTTVPATSSTGFASGELGWLFLLGCAAAGAYDLRHVQRVVTAPLWLPSFGARDGNGPRHPLHRVGVLGSGGRHSPATSVGCPSLATVGVPSSRVVAAAHSEDFIISACFSIATLPACPRVLLLKRSRWLWPAGRRRLPQSRSDGMPGFQPFETLLSEPLVVD